MKTTLLFLSVFLTTSLFCQNVYIPDANFKEILVGNPEINTNGDTEIQVSEASSFDGGINCNWGNILDLTGIEAFIDLTILQCFGNQLTSLDLSHNNALIELYCGENQLTSLDVSQNTALTYLDCKNNQITSLDISQNTSLIYLNCENNLITSIDLNFALEGLNCENNQLTSLDLSHNNALIELYCGENQLTSLDVSQNTDLTYLNCIWNQLTSLDVSQNIFLEYIWCGANQLTCLNIANGNNNVFGFGDYLFSGNPNLNCIQVDDAAWSTANWTSNIDPQQYFSEDCDYPSDCFTTSLTELTTSKNLIQILDMMGSETSFKPNTPLIYVYDDGSTEKVFSVEY